MSDFKSTSGKEYILRADLNALGRLQARYGTLGETIGRLESVEELLRIASELINEHFYSIGSSERVTPAALGASLSGTDLEPLTQAVVEAVGESVGTVKKKKPRRERTNGSRSGG